MKKLSSLILSLVLASLLILPLTGCNEPNEGKIMTVELNPQVEFILDANDKVVTVNALNDEGNYVIAKVDFVGKTADEALNAFLKISVEDGFLLEGEITTSENNLKISVSGEDAQKLYDDVKKKAQEYLEGLPDVRINVNFDFSTITKEDIEALVQDCMRELKVEEIKEKTNAELLKLLEASREKTSELLSQELKDCYYAERALLIKQAQLDAYIEAVKTQNNSIVLNATLEGVQAQLDNLVTMVNDYKAQYKQKFLDVTSEYHLKMQECLKTKKELLKARLDGASEEVLKTLEASYNSAVSLMESAKQLAKVQIETVDNAVNQLIDTIQTTVKGFVETFNLTVENVDSIVKEALEETKSNFDKAFKDENGEYVANKYWKNLDPDTAA